MQTRTRVHTFDKGGFDQGAKAGREAVSKSENLLQATRAEQRYRRNGLLVSIGLMSFLAVAMAFKIRELSRRRAKANEGRRTP